MTSSQVPTLSSGVADAGLVEAFVAVRRASEALCEPLATEDYVVQSMPDVSPTKWHLAHTSWFFETFMLTPLAVGYEPFDPSFAYLFNSYYVTVGDRHCRQNRGLLSRPTVADVYAYRRHIDRWMHRLLESPPPGRADEIRSLLAWGINHEQQHQELMLTDIKHVFWVNPLRPAYRAEAAPEATGPAPAMRWAPFPGGVESIGLDPAPGQFCFDNETPRHKVYLEPFELGSRLVTNGEYKAFIADGGYDRPDLWLSMGLATARAEGWRAPLYWIERDGQWAHHTLGGVRPVDDASPVAHVSYFEADAFARWAGARLATEAEWESAADRAPLEGSFVESGRGGPMPDRGDASESPAPRQMFGELWQWTASAYLPYPGYHPPTGALGEYNGKFMCNQFVLRGGSCATPRSHLRRAYRNFFPPDARWQFSGIRLARSVEPLSA